MCLPPPEERRFPEGGIVYAPMAFGAELFLWAHGHPELSANDITSTDIEFAAAVEVQAPEGCVRVSDLPDLTGGAGRPSDEVLDED